MILSLLGKTHNFTTDSGPLLLQNPIHHQHAIIKRRSRFREGFYFPRVLKWNRGQLLYERYNRVRSMGYSQQLINIGKRYIRSIFDYNRSGRRNLIPCCRNINRNRWRLTSRIMDISGIRGDGLNSCPCTNRLCRLKDRDSSDSWSRCSPVRTPFVPESSLARYLLPTCAWRVARSGRS